MKFNIFLFFSQLFILCSQYEVISGKAIIGHNIREAQSGDFPYIVSIMRMEAGNPHSGGQHFCSGVVISKLDVLTAEHCVIGEEFNSTQLVIGTIDLRNGQVYRPFWWQTYNQWAVANNVTLEIGWNDMGNIRLLSEVPNNVVPVRLSRLSNTELYNAHVIIAGWGINNQGIIPELMNVATLQVIENNVCQNRIERVAGMRIPISIRLLCTVISPYVLIEYGDSGGPLLFRNRLIGLNSGICPSGHQYMQNTQINLHLGVHYYRPFISYMKNHQ